MATVHLGADALAWILGVADSAEFVEQHLGQRWYHAPHEQRDRFSELLSLGELDEILGTHGLGLSKIRLVRADEDIPLEYTWRGGLVDPIQAARLFAEGSTVVFQQLQDRHEGMRRVCSGITRQIGARSQTNIYLTPPRSQGFKPHWDTHDVYVLQVEGSKLWRMYEDGPEFPLKDQKFDPDKHEAGEVTAEFTLEAGEVLYIPRGQMHAAKTPDCVSLHITLGVMAYTWAHLLADCLSDLVERSTDWRQNVTMRHQTAASDGHESAEARLSGLLNDLSAQVDVPKVLEERFAAVDAIYRPRTTDLLRQSVAADRVNVDAGLARRPGVPASVTRRDDRWVVDSGQRQLDFPEAAGPLLQQVFGSGGSGAIHLTEDGLDQESRRVVLSTLIREGLLTTELPDTGPEA